MLEEYLERDEELRLARAWRNDGDRRARDRIVLAYRRLVVSMARRYVSPSMPLEDLVAEGNCALLVAIDRFDPEAGCRFVTYAQWWVRAMLQDLVQRELCPVRIGRSRREKIVLLRLAMARRRESQIDDAQRAAIAAKAGSDERLVQLIESAYMSRFGGRARSGDEEAIELVADEAEGEASILDRQLEKVRHRVVDKLVAGLDERERQVIVARHLSDRAVTLRELAAALDLTNEGVRKIEIRCIERMRQSLKRAGLRARDLVDAG